MAVNNPVANRNDSFKLSWQREDNEDLCAVIFEISRQF